MNRKRLLAFDADGVIVDFGRTLYRELNRRLNRRFRYEEIYDHNMAVVYGISESEMWLQATQIYAEVGVANLPAIHGAIKGLRELEADFNFAIITSRVDEFREATDVWFQRRGLKVELYFSQGANNPYAGGSGRRTKHEIASGIGAICLVEDNPHEFTSWPDSAVEPICLARPWNRGLPKVCPGIPRMAWRELVAHLRERYL